MAVDVLTATVIDRPRAEVAAYTSDFASAPRWYVNIESARWETDPPLRVGSRFAFVAHFMKRRLEYTYEVVAYEPGVRLVMRTAQGPFPMETTYTFEDTSDGGTRLTLRNRGMPAGFSRWFAPFMAFAMRRANNHDLVRLKGILESDSQ